MYGHERKIVKSRYHDESLLEFLNMKISCNNEETRRQSEIYIFNIGLESLTFDKKKEDYGEPLVSHLRSELPLF